MNAELTLTYLITYSYFSFSSLDLELIQRTQQFNTIQHCNCISCVQLAKCNANSIEICIKRLLLCNLRDVAVETRRLIGGPANYARFDVT